jgi:hypothetical protein
MPESKVLNLPLSTDEIISIILQRIEARMRQNCFFSHAATYAGFSYSFDMNIKFQDMMQNRDTLVWDKHDEGKVIGGSAESPVEAITEKFDSGDSPNRVRQDHDMELPVEVKEGRRTVIKKMKFGKVGKAS